MIEEKNNKKNKVIKGIALLGLFLMIFGISYALFRVTLNGKKTNKITTAKFDVRLTTTDGIEEKDLPEGVMGVNLEGSNAVPMTQEEGMSLEPYKFVVQNRGSVEASYKLTLEDIEGITNTLNDQYIRYNLVRKDYYDYREYHEGDFANGYYTTESNIQRNNNNIKIGYMAPLLSKIENRVLDETTLMPNECIEYTLNLWIDENATIEQASEKEFAAKIKVDATQASVFAKGKAGDNINYTYYKDGTLIFTGEGAISGFDINAGNIVGNGNAFIDIIYNKLVEKGYAYVEVNDDNCGAYFTLSNLINSYNYIYDDVGGDNYEGGGKGDTKSSLEYISNSAEERMNVIRVTREIPKVNRIMISNGITSIGALQLNEIAEILVSLPNTLESIETLAMLSSGTIYLNVPESVSFVGETAVRLHDEGKIFINNTEEYVQTYWDENWAWVYGDQIIYLK